MFQPGWRPKQRNAPTIQAPPIVNKRVQVSPHVFYSVPNDRLVQLGDDLIAQYDGDIRQFVSGQRQQISISNNPQYSSWSSFGYGAIVVRFNENQGTEVVDITAFPENSPQFAPLLTPTSSQTTSEGAGAFAIEAKFINWPLAGYSFFVNTESTGFYAQTIDDSVDITRGYYSYEPCFTPLPATVSDPSQNMMELGLQPGVAVPGWQNIALDETQPGLSDLSMNKVGGSGIAITPVVGQQYWEVQVVTLPPPGTVPPTAGRTIDGQSFTWSWLSELDTFFSPAIGLVPKCYLDPKWAENTVAYGGGIGIDFDASQPRSIGGVRTSLTQLDTGSYDGVSTLTLAPWPMGDYFPTAGTFTGVDDTGAPTGQTLGGLNTIGRHFWVFKGRADLVPLALAAPTQDADAPVGVWTGVDLGDLQEKDIIMVAADTQSRGVWFGKNGKWYDQSGPTELQPGPNLDPATFMDGDAPSKADPGTPYFPACSWRVGPVKLFMLFAGLQVYLPPSGFQAYTSPGAGGFPVNS